MEKSMTDTFHVVSTTSFRHRLFLFCITLSFLGYLLYSHFANISIARVQPGRQRAPLDNQHMSRGLLHENYDWDTTEEDWDEATTAVLDDEEPPDASSGSLSRKLPQAIIIGVKKGGTRALLEFLRLHPDITCARAEPHFFDQNYHRGLEWYRKLMPLSTEHQMTIEKSPAYFVTKEAPARILAMSKSVKLLVVIRDPVTRAISDYSQALDKRPNLPSFESLAFKNESKVDVDTNWNAIQIGLYDLHLQNWIQYFPLSQMLFVNGERLIKSPAEEMSRVQEFLGVKKLITEKNFEFDKDKGFYCLKRAEENYEIPHCLGKSKGRPHPEVAPQDIKNLKAFFSPSNKVFFKMIGEDFGWDKE